jgi:type I restriction enzyme S subunit
LGELCEFRAGAAFKTHLQGNTSGEIPFVKVSDMNLPGNAVQIREANNWVSRNQLKELKAKPLPSGTVVFAKIGEALRQNRLRQIVRDTVVDNNMMGAVPRVDKVEPRFFYYALSQFDFSSIAQGTALPYLTVTSLSGLSLEVPHFSEQRAIAHILGTLDDKIELNHRMNETLEAIARAMFKSWFVDFDPVRAKMSGEPSESICQRLGLTPDLLALFPDHLVDSELGEIPERWEVKPLPAVIEVNPARALKKGVVAPYLDMANMPTTGARALSVVEREFGSGMKFENGDTLVARITPCLENGKTCFVDFLSDGQVGWGSTEYIVLRPKQRLPDEYVYFLARTDMFRSHAIANMTGTSGRQRVPATAFDRFLLVMPNAELAREFGRFASGVIKKMRANDEESKTQSTIRDALLPKLLSGELDVRAALDIEG